jgi:hypothetical protein
MRQTVISRIGKQENAEAQHACNIDGAKGAEGGKDLCSPDEPTRRGAETNAALARGPGTALSLQSMTSWEANRSPMVQACRLSQIAFYEIARVQCCGRSLLTTLQCAEIRVLRD